METIVSNLFSMGYYAVIFGLGMLVMVYFKQENMLYNPDYPSKEMKHPESNPKGFRNP